MPKSSQEAVHYRDGYPKRCCGFCGSFVAMHRCARVDGLVAAHKLCDLYARKEHKTAEPVWANQSEVSASGAKQRKLQMRWKRLEEQWRKF